MLAEAVTVDRGLRLNNDGEALLKASDPPEAPQIHNSWNLSWWTSEQIPRMEIDNSLAYPFKRAAWGSNGGRDPSGLRRNDTVFLHATAGSMRSIQGKIEIRHTKALPPGS